jgi:putative aldouronate transport system substrate-binding protein
LNSLRKQLNKWVLILLAITLVATLAACGNNSSNEPAKEVTTDKPANTAAEKPKEEPKKDPVTLRIELFDRNNTPPGAEPITNNFFTRYAQEKFGDPNNIKLEYVTVPRSEEVDKLNVLMAANQAPDLSFTYDTPTIQRYVKDGGITDLGPIIDEHGSNLKKVLGDNVMSYGQFEGKQYAVVARRVIEAQVTTYIRQDWLDELMLPVPTTTEEFYNTMVAFKKAHPEAIPYGGQTDFFHTSALRYSFFDWNNITAKDLYANPDWALPGNKEAFQFMNKLYSEGLIDKDFPLGMGKDTNQFAKNMANGLMGAATTNTNEPVIMGYLAESIKNNPKAVYTVIDPFSDANGKTPKPAYSPNGIYLIVPKASERAVEVVKYLDWMAMPENIIAFQNGTEGETFKYVDGVPKSLENDAAKNLLYNYADYCMILNGKYVSNDDQLLNIAANASDPIYSDFTIKSIDTGMKDGITKARVLATVDSEVKLATVLKKKSEEDMFVKILTAKPADFDKVYEAEVKDYLKIGGQEMMDEKQAKYDAEYN